MKSVGVAIASFNTCDLLAACLDSLQARSLLLHIVVVDNASADDSAALVRTRFPRITLIEAGRNLRFAVATDLAIGRVYFASSAILLSCTLPSQVSLKK